MWYPPVVFNLAKPVVWLIFSALLLVVGVGPTACSGEVNPSDGSLTAGCSAEQLACDGFCVDPLVNGGHCGECDLECEPGTGCQEGVCTPGAVSLVEQDLGPTNCSSNEISCSGTCVEPQTDDQNCGGCGQSCPLGNVCDEGSCRSIGEGCPAGRTLCGMACVNLSSSAAHCGMCNSSCGSGVCIDAACTCAPGTTQCETGCKELATDSSNCGACGTQCEAGESCESGSCVCLPTHTLCDGSCTDTSADIEHCGACGNACAANEECNGGACSCLPGFDSCANGCADLMSSQTDCGTCGNACPGGQQCAQGSCACADDMNWCTDVCANFDTDAKHCGACDQECAPTQVCSSGQCTCPDGQTVCGDACYDTQTSAEHCGGCDLACAQGQVCVTGGCECPANQELCPEGCVDLQADLGNCGGCGVECVDGQTCEAGSCECPEGESLCNGACIDTASDSLNCGSCDNSCGLGELCNESACTGGGRGDDQCEGIAQGLSLAKLSFYQTVEIPVMEQGAEVADRIVDLVAGRDTLVRAFVEVDDSWTSRTLSARLHLENGEAERTTLYTSAPQLISASSVNEARDSTFEFEMPGELLSEQTVYAVEIVECGEAPDVAVQSPRFPMQSGSQLNALDSGGLRVHIVPLGAGGFEPDVSEEALEPYRAAFLATYPVAAVEFSVGDVVQVANADDWESNLENLRYQREAENADDDVYYYGMLRPTEDIRDFCGGGCTAGVGYVPSGGPFGGGPGARVALGLAYPGNIGNGIDTMLHEVGHNHGRSHAPCGGPAGVDPQYPYPDAQIGVWGFDLRDNRLLTPDHPDIMAYCQQPWFSDYTYRALLSTVVSVNNVQQTRIASADRLGDFWVLLVNSSGATRWGHPRPGPVLAEGAPELATVLDAAGVAIETLEVYRTEISDIHAASIQVPAPQPGWHSIVVQGAQATPF